MNAFVVNDLKVNKNTVVDWYMFCHEVCMLACVKESAKLGGVGEIVEIDESLFGKMKYGKGRRVNGKWVFGGVQRESKKCFFSVVESRTKEELFKCSQLTSLGKNALREIKLRLSYLQGKSTTMSVIAHQTEKEWISANEKSRQRMSQIQAEGAAEQHAARLEDAHLRAHHSCFTSERC
ncbi:putative transposase-like protein [Trichonephila clavipes]|nr:putative transposase-like protein [Trichonephila clavipes]